MPFLKTNFAFSLLFNPHLVVDESSPRNRAFPIVWGLSWMLASVRTAPCPVVLLLSPTRAQRMTWLHPPRGRGMYTLNFTTLGKRTKTPLSLNRHWKDNLAVSLIGKPGHSQCQANLSMWTGIEKNLPTWSVQRNIRRYWNMVQEWRRCEYQRKHTTAKCWYKL